MGTATPTQNYLRLAPIWTRKERKIALGIGTLLFVNLPTRRSLEFCFNSLPTMRK